MPIVYYSNRVGDTLTSLGTLPTATVTRQDTEQIAIVATDMTLDSVGKYSYDFEDPDFELGYDVLLKEGASPLITVEVFGETDINYANITDGNTYFAGHLWSDSWDSATNVTKQWAIKEATSRLEKLAYANLKTDVDQTKEQPRGGVVEVPEVFMEACLDIALKLLDGFIPEEEANLLNVSSQAYAGARTTFDTQIAGKPWISTGILSKDAWDKIVPYLLNSSALRLIRA